MDQSHKSKFTMQQVMASLSAVAYMPFHSINTLQENLNDAGSLEAAYTAVWWGKNGSLVVYVVKNKYTNDYAVIFKGKAFRPALAFLIKLYEDLDLGHQEPLPYSRLGGAKVALGILDIIQEIGTSSYGGRTLQQVLNHLPVRTKVYMAGHSLGGSLATVYAAKIACSNAAELDIIPYTFGAPAVGNDLFANLFDPTHVNFLFTRSSRCINTRDIMPFAFNDLRGITTVDYGKTTCSVDFKVCLECLERLLILSRVFYTQPPPELELKGDDGWTDSFFRKALHQHQPNTYLNILGLDPIDKAEFYHAETSEFILTDSE
jgi:hypothetical protein